MGKEFVNPRYFDCRLFIKPGDWVSIERSKDNDEFIGEICEVAEVFEKFIKIRTMKAQYMCNRWNILHLNGHKVVAGCFVNCPTLNQRGGKA